MMNISDLINGTESTPFECTSPSTPNIVPTQVMVVAVLQGIISSVGLLGNALVIFVLIMARDRQDTSSVIYVLNLALADFWFLATVPFKISQDITMTWNFGEFMCKFAGGFVTYLNFFVSPLFLMVMSIDRYLAVNKAVSSAKLRALKSSRFVSMAVWLVAVCAVVPLAFLHTTYPEQMHCKPKFPGSEVSPISAKNFCQIQQDYMECTRNYILDRTEEIRTDLLPEALGDTFSRMKRKVGTTKKSPKKGKNKQNKRKNRKKQKDKKNRKKNKNQKSSTSEAVLSKSIKPQELKAPKQPFVVKESQVTTVLPLGSTTEQQRGFLLSVSKISTSTRRFELTTALQPIHISTSTQRFELTTALQPISPNHKNITDFSSNIDPALEMEAEMECWKQFWPGNEEPACYHDQPYSFHVWVVLNFFYSYLIPCSAIVICYMAILHKLYQPSGMARSQESRGRIRRQTMRKKVTLMVAMLVISYFICFTPYYIWQLINIQGLSVKSMKTCQDFRRFNATMAYVNSALNPLLYTFLSDQFGAKFRLAWRRVTRKTAYHLGTIMTARDKHSHISKNKHSDKRNIPIVPHDQTCKSSDKVEEDQRHLMDSSPQSNGNSILVVADVAAVGTVEQDGSKAQDSASKSDTNGDVESSRKMSLKEQGAETMDV